MTIEVADRLRERLNRIENRWGYNPETHEDVMFLIESMRILITQNIAMGMEDQEKAVRVADTLLNMTVDRHILSKSN